MGEFQRVVATALLVISGVKLIKKRAPGKPDTTHVIWVGTLVKPPPLIVTRLL